MSSALKAFYDATVELGVASQVTTFTASDFGRTYISNGEGSDHGWGAHHLVLGGAVTGGRFYGQLPTLAKWFGVSTGNLSLVFPNLGRFDTPDMGFLV